MDRVLEPEWLDTLPPGDTRAQRSRSDLRRVNVLMGNARHVAAVLRSVCRPPDLLCLADLGAGDGSFIRSVLRRLKQPAVHVTLVDRAIVPEDIRWNAKPVVADVFDFLAPPEPRFDAIVANLFLHHFDHRALGRLLRLAARRAPLLVACEPRRSRLALQASRLLGALGCNDVTRHDAAVSVRAGFAGRELSSLWPQADGWRLTERLAPPFGHLFIARRDAA